MKRINAAQTKEMVLYVADQMIASKQLLCEIDGKIGDGDHGFGMERGFLAAKDVLSGKEYQTVNDVFRETGLAMLNSMGGASGVIFSRIFLGVLGQAPADTLTPVMLHAIFKTALQKIKEQGKAAKGDKTMVDAFEPAVEVMENTNEGATFQQMLEQAVSAASMGVEATKSYAAKFGRAKFLHDRSVGFQDAGATSVWLILKSMNEWFCSLETGGLHS